MLPGFSTCQSTSSGEDEEEEEKEEEKEKEKEEEEDITDYLYEDRAIDK